jgi:hypothetical protein
MIIAMAITGDQETIVPIIEGETIRLYDTETEQVSDFENPANNLTTGKRSAVIKWANNKGVKVLCSPPSMLCELSYDLARQEQFQYYRVKPHTSFSALQSLIKENGLELVAALPLNEIEPSVIAPAKQ